MSPDPTDRSLDLLARCLTRELFFDEERRELSLRQVLATLRHRHFWHRIRGWRLSQPNTFDPTTRAEGRDWPPKAETMVGSLRLANVRDCVATALADGVQGDLEETGVWRGGASIYLKATLEVLGDSDRHVWVCDSFEGLPAPDPTRYPLDAGSEFHKKPELAVGVEDVRQNFERYGLLDDRVHFVEGWFRGTMVPLAANLDRIAVLRFDGDLYESATDVLGPLEPLVAPGGFVIIDDYNSLESCRQAIDDYRAEHGITAPMQRIDWSASYWRKPLVGTRAL